MATTTPETIHGLFSTDKVAQETTKMMSTLGLLDADSLAVSFSRTRMLPSPISEGQFDTFLRRIRCLKWCQQSQQSLPFLQTVQSQCHPLLRQTRWPPPHLRPEYHRIQYRMLRVRME